MARRAAPQQPYTTDARIAVLVGDEPFLRAASTDAIRSALEQAHGGVEVIAFDGASAAPADVLDECRSLGLMQQHRLVLVDNADLFVRDHRKAVEHYAQSPSPHATLVLRAAKWNKGNLDAQIRKVGTFIPCDRPTPAQARTWATRRAREAHGARIESQAADALVERVGPDLARLDAELAKLALAAQDGPITAALVAEMVGRSREEEFWSIQQALLTGDPAHALRHLHAILDTGPSGSHVPVTWACLDLARKLHAVAHASRQGISPRQLRSDLRLFGPSVDAVLAAGRSLDPRRARQLLHHAVTADFNQKQSVGEPYRTLEVLALRFAGL